jgi:hypothetical protein
MYAAETNGDQVKLPVEEGISEEVAQKLQEKSSNLTQIRKQKGKKLPEELATVDEIKAYKCTGSHTVCIFNL